MSITFDDQLRANNDPEGVQTRQPTRHRQPADSRPLTASPSALHHFVSSSLKQQQQQQLVDWFSADADASRPNGFESDRETW